MQQELGEADIHRLVVELTGYLEVQIQGKYKLDDYTARVDGQLHDIVEVRVTQHVNKLVRQKLHEVKAAAALAAPADFSAVALGFLSDPLAPAVQPSGGVRAVAPHADASDALAPIYTCGGCGEQQSSPMAHKCARPSCGKDLHSYLKCVHVFMPDEGRYFCGAECIGGYNLENQGGDRVPCMYRADVAHAPLPRPNAARVAATAVAYDSLSAVALGFLSDSITQDPILEDPPIEECFKCTFPLFQSHLDDRSAILVDGRPCCFCKKSCREHLKEVEAAKKVEASKNKRTRRGSRH